MKITEGMQEVPFSRTFSNLYEIRDEDNFILNSIKIYALMGGVVLNERDIDFSVETMKIMNTGRVAKFIRPSCFKNYDSFLMCGNRIVNCKKVEIKADEYIDKFEHNGNFTFTIRED